MSALVDERVIDEVAALEAIMMSEVEVKRVDQVPHTIETVVYPATGNVVEKQYVCVTLEIVLSENYPDTSPDVLLRNPRGLEASFVDSMDAQIKMKLESSLGQPVVFELIEMVRETLTESNQPTGKCAICLGDFAQTDAFSKTNCYHFFHSYCLGKHILFAEQNYNEEMDKLPHWQRVQEPPFRQTCPVCRCQTECDVQALKNAPPPSDYMVAEAFQLTPELEALQAKMAGLLAKQVAKGGVVGSGDNGPPLLTITTAEDRANFQAAAAARAREANKAAEMAAARPAPRPAARPAPRPAPQPAQASAANAPDSPKGRIRAYRRGKHGRGGRGHGKGGSR